MKRFVCALAVLVAVAVGGAALAHQTDGDPGDSVAATLALADVAPVDLMEANTRAELAPDGFLGVTVPCDRSRGTSIAGLFEPADQYNEPDLEPLNSTPLIFEHTGRVVAAWPSRPFPLLC